MRLSLSASVSLVGLGFTNAVRLNLKRAPGAGAHIGSYGSPTAQVEGEGEAQLNNVNNQRYTTDITLNGVDIVVLLDTGSTDLWVQSDLGAGLTFENVSAKLAFGDGSTFVNGQVATTQLEFGGYTVPQQAFLNASSSQGFASDFSNGINGILGLSFDSPGASKVNDAVKAAFGDDVKWGQSTLANIFDQNPDKENLIGMSLSRTGDLEDTDEGSLDIGEIGEEDKDVQNQPKLPLFPKGNGRWSVLMDGMTVNNKSIPLTSLGSGVPAGKHISLLDSGTTNVLLAPSFINAIYSEIEGAVFAPNTSLPFVKFSEDSNQWVVPCLAPASFSAQFGGQTFPVHPLDLTDITTVTASDGNQYTVCLAAFTSIGNIGGTSFDGLWGASFLRNTYTVYDFGDSKTTDDPTDNAFIQLLSQTDATKALADVLSVRAETLKSMPKELAPADIIALFDGAGPTVKADTDLNSFAEAGETTAPSSTNDLIAKWAPVVVGLLGANLVIGLILIALGVITCVKRGGKPKVATYASVPYKEV